MGTDAPATAPEAARLRGRLTTGRAQLCFTAMCHLNLDMAGLCCKLYLDGELPLYNYIVLLSSSGFRLWQIF